MRWIARGTWVVGGLFATGCTLEDVAHSEAQASTELGYPAGPHGVEVGEVVPPDLTVSGFSASGTRHTVAATDWFDPDGERVNALLVVTSGYGCVPCYEQADALEDRMDVWGPMGIDVVTFIIDGMSGERAEADDAWRWKESFGLERVGVFADPKLSLVPADRPAAKPQQTVIDPRTMRVVARIEGVPESYVALEQLADDNGRQP